MSSDRLGNSREGMEYMENPDDNTSPPTARGMPFNIPSPTYTQQINFLPSSSSTSSSSSLNTPAVGLTKVPVSSNIQAKREKPLIRRRRHKNSKLGCPNCKRRRVKCSEDLPSCMNCIKHKVKCGYLSYTPEQIEELQQGKLSQLEDMMIDGPPKKSNSLASKYPSISKEEVNKSTSFSEIFGSYKRSIVQDYDNLLTLNTSGNDNPEIIYPVYSINNNNMISAPVDYVTLQNSRPGLVNTASGTSLHRTGSQQMNDHITRVRSGESSKGPFYSTTDDRTHEQANETRLNGFRLGNTLVSGSTKELPGAITRETKFEITPTSDETNYVAKLDVLMSKLVKEVTNGQASLPSIRELYHTWINSFTCRAYQSQMMFSCLINLATNYMVSNLINNSSFEETLHAHKSGVHGLLEKPNDQKTKFKNLLILKSIKHYATVIKELRYYLNKNLEPELCSSASYLLLLMSVYDPEATLNSTICFKDGLFSILTYNLAFSMRKNYAIPHLIPMHLQLMKNIVRSVYMPGYDASFLRELRGVMRNFGCILKSMVADLLTSTSINTHDANILKISELHFDHLYGFTNDTINKFVPLINLTLDDIQKQKECLFDMIYTWIRLLPSSLSIMSTGMHPIQKILYLLYKLMSKSMFAVFPQIKFFFLRDFDSPLMSDVVHDMMHLVRCLQHDSFIQQNEKLRKICNYGIRLTCFFQTRISILYKLIVYDERFKPFLDIKDIPGWIKSIDDIGVARNNFIEITRLKETPIKRFLLTRIERKNYPEVGLDGSTGSESAFRDLSISVDSIPEEDYYEDDDLEYDFDEDEEDFEDLLNSEEISPTGFYSTDFVMS